MICDILTMSFKYNYVMQIIYNLYEQVFQIKFKCDFFHFQHLVKER